MKGLRLRGGMARLQGTSTKASIKASVKASSKHGPRMIERQQLRHIKDSWTISALMDNIRVSMCVEIGKQAKRLDLTQGALAERAGTSPKTLKGHPPRPIRSYDRLEGVASLGYPALRPDSLSVKLTPQAAFERLMLIGGFPEPFIKGEDRFAKRWRRDRIDRIITEDIRDLELVRDLTLIGLFADALRTRVSC
jgi:hypothetical protein